MKELFTPPFFPAAVIMVIILHILAAVFGRKPILSAVFALVNAAVHILAVVCLMINSVSSEKLFLFLLLSAAAGLAASKIGKKEGKNGGI